MSTSNSKNPSYFMVLTFIYFTFQRENAFVSSCFRVNIIRTTILCTFLHHQVQSPPHRVFQLFGQQHLHATPSRPWEAPSLPANTSPCLSRQYLCAVEWCESGWKEKKAAGSLCTHLQITRSLLVSDGERVPKRRVSRTRSFTLSTRR